MINPTKQDYGISSEDYSSYTHISSYLQISFTAWRLYTGAWDCSEQNRPRNQTKQVEFDNEFDFVFNIGGGSEPPYRNQTEQDEIEQKEGYLP